MGKKYNFKLGEIYGIYEVIDETIYRVQNKTGNGTRGHIKVKCTLCNKTQFKRGDTVKDSKTKKCRTCSNREKWRKNVVEGRINSVGYSPHHQGVGDLPKSLYWHFKKCARMRDHSFEVSIEYLWELFEKQEHKCALSGVELHLFKKGVPILKKTKNSSSNIDFSAFNASLDRIDSAGNYTEDNVQWVHRDVNFMKHVFDQDYFINVCTNIALTQKRKQYE